MSYFRDRATGNYITLQQAQAEFSNISVGNPLATSDYDALNIDPVIETPRPSTTLIQKSVLAPAVQNSNGNWETDYTILDLSDGLTADQLVSFKQSIADTLSSQFAAKRSYLVAAGFQYNFSGYNTDAGVACSSLTPNGTAGILTIQMDSGSQINWLGVTAEAQVAIATATYDISSLTLDVDGAGYTPGTGYALTATGNGSGFSGTVDVDATGNLTNPVLIAGGTGYNGTTTIVVDLSAGTPTTPGVITPVVQKPTNFALRVLENYNVIVPASDIVMILGAAARWATTLVFTAAGLKDQVNSMITDTTKTPADLLTVTWPTSS